jgi:hypothetical protein
MAQSALFREARRLATRRGMREYQFEIIPGANDCARRICDGYENAR